ncbi:MAG: hypothetical protein TREMPRED_002640, partial [Tremellales sp. Tagirdzhanova-0007]
MSDTNVSALPKAVPTLSGTELRNGAVGTELEPYHITVAADILLNPPIAARPPSPQLLATSLLHVTIKHIQNRKPQRTELIVQIQAMANEWARQHNDDPNKLWRAIINSQTTRWARSPSPWDIFLKCMRHVAQGIIARQREEEH